MAKSNAQRQAEWRLRRKQELESLRNKPAGTRKGIANLADDEFNFLMLQLAEYRARNNDAGNKMDRFDALTSVMRMKVESDRTREAIGKADVRKLKPANKLNRDLFDPQ